MAIVKILPINTRTHLNNLIDYVQQQEKTDNVITTCNLCQQDSIYNDFMITKTIYNKNDKILAHQLIQSFPVGETDVETAHAIAQQLADETFPMYQCIISTHKDKEHIHSHIVLNSVNSLTGQKYHSNLQSLAIARYNSDELCKKYNLSVIDEKTGYRSLDKTTYELAKEGRSWKVILSNDIDNVLAKVDNKDDFIKEFEKMGYQIKWQNKNIVFTPKNETKSIRANTLAKQFGTQYTKENIEKSLGITNQEIELNQTFLRNVPVDLSKSEKAKIEKFIKKEEQKEINNFKNREYNKKTNVPKKNKNYNPYKINRFYSLESFAMQVFKRIFYVAPTFSNMPYNQKSYKKNYTRFGNISYERLKKEINQNLLVTIELTKKEYENISNLNVLHCGVITDKNKIKITFLEKDKKAIEQKLQMNTNIDLKIERVKYAEFRKKADFLDEKLCSYNLDKNDIKKLKNANIEFATMTKEKNISTFFFFKDLEKVCEVLDKNFTQEFSYWTVIFNQKKENFGNIRFFDLQAKKTEILTVPINEREKELCNNLDIEHTGMKITTKRENKTNDVKIFVSFEKKYEKEIEEKLEFSKNIALKKTVKERIEEESLRRLKVKKYYTRQEIYQYKITNDELEKIKKTNVQFANVEKDSVNTLHFLQKDLKKVCEVLGKDYQKEFDFYKNKKEFNKYTNKIAYKDFQEIGTLQNKTCKYNNITLEQVKKLEKENIKIYHYKTNDYTFNVCFYKNDLEKVCEILDKDFTTEFNFFEQAHNRQNYAELKQTANLNNDKLEYRIISAAQLQKLQEQEKIKISYFKKDDNKYNVVFENKNRKEINEILYNQEQQKEINNQQQQTVKTKKL